MSSTASSIRKTSLSRSRLLLAVLLALGAAQTTVRADVNRWSSILPDRTIHSIAVHPTLPDTVYAGAVGAIFKTEDGGRSWRQSATPIATAFDVRSIVFDPTDPSIVYAAALGVAKSTDAGATWAAAYSGMERSANPLSLDAVFSLVIDPDNRAILYAGTSRGDVFQTTNGATTWQLRRNGLPALQGSNGVRALVIDPDRPSTVYAGFETSGVYKTVDAGLSWTSANAGLDNFGVVELAIDPHSPNRVFAGTRLGGLYRSLDAGASWSRVLAPSGFGVPEITVPELEVDPFSPNVVYAGTSTGGLGIFRSADGGETWTRFNDGLPQEPDFRALAIAPSAPTRVYGGLFNWGVFAITLTEPCSTGGDALCLNGGRFRVRVNWKAAALGSRGVGQALPLTSDTGYFWFFSDNNIELVVKVVDGRAVNGRIWVFYGALSDVEYTIAVTDSQTGSTRTYRNPPGRLASVADTTAFVIDGVGEAAPESAPAPRQIAECGGDALTLCLNASRFRVRVAWRAPNLGTAGSGQAVALTSDTGYFWFFSDNNVELVIKVVDGRAFNGRFWVFYGALSDVEYTITVTDTETGAERAYFNPSGQLASVADTAAF
ncbi:MAG: hypothetical protein M3547_04315 [Acidobacteriota bacterium]|nr:hypothetical protein [Acidobacteriota bacterium]